MIPEALKERFISTLAPSWRQNGDRNKKIWKDVLQRQGHLRTSEVSPATWENLFLLEAIIEHYAHSTIYKSGNTSSTTVDLSCPLGNSAKLEAGWVYFNEPINLSLIRAGKDTIWLFDKPDLPSVFRIIDIDSTRHRIQIATSDISSSSRPIHLNRWAVNRRPQLILIDSFGNRLKGHQAVIVNQSTIQLDRSLSSLKLNEAFDTIFLAADKERSSQTYRIIHIDPENNTITLDGSPTFTEPVSSWEIPAGVTDWLPPIEYDLGPGTQKGRGWDHYHGVLFLVYQNRVHSIYPWTSYTSRNYESGSALLSSIRGNRRYTYNSQRAASTAAINYAFSVFDSADFDKPIAANYYFSDVVTSDDKIRSGESEPGKTEIMIHIGYTRAGQSSTGDGSGSAGCLVSPSFYSFRDQLINLYQDEHILLYNHPDTRLRLLQGLNHDQSIALWKHTQSADIPEADQLLPADWNNKLRGDLWLIRPDERPLG